MGQNILIEISARHIHLSKEHLEILFGEGYELTVKKMLSQPGQFACEERVSVIGPKGKFSMSVLGPVRERTQVEICTDRCQDHRGQRAHTGIRRCGGKRQLCTGRPQGNGYSEGRGYCGKTPHTHHGRRMPKDWG